MSVNHCPRCKAQLAADAPQGLCPACLLEQAFLTPGLAAEPADTSAQTRRFVPPTIEELTGRFSQLEVLELLGQGGMGAVYKVRQRMLDRIVALKILPREISRDPTFAERFTREARALAKLSHPNIVTVFEFGETDGLYYLMMEFVDGASLRETIQSQSIAPSAALAVISQICNALQYAHDEGVVHRDIKPENVLLDLRGRVKIADFGLAKLLGLSPIDVTLTGSHQVMGTFHYMAPEQFERPLEVDHRADIYSLGVVFYELLTGELPLGRFKLPSEKRHLDVRLDDVVLKALEREPKQRYQHVSEVKTDVDHISSSDAMSTSPANDSPRTAQKNQLPTVPFALQRDALYGISLGHGLMRLKGDGIALEFKLSAGAVVNPFYLGFKPGLHEVEIQLDDITGLRLEKGWFGATLRIETDSVRSVYGVPGADRGRVALAIASQDAKAAAAFVHGVRPRIGGEVTAEQSPPAKPPKPDMSAPGDLGLKNSRLKIPAIGLCVAGAIDCLALLAFGVVLVVYVLRQSTPGIGLPGPGVMELMIIAGGTIFGVGRLVGGVSMISRRSYALSVCGAICAVLPCSLTWLIGMPFGIWSLIVLNTPEARREFELAAEWRDREAFEDEEY